MPQVASGVGSRRQEQHRRDHGLLWKSIVPGIPEQNDVSECLRQTLMTKVQAMV